MTRPAKTALALGKIDLEEKTTDLRLNVPRYVTLPNIMKAKRKPLDVIPVESLHVDVAARLGTLRVSEPPPRPAGIRVASVGELVAALAGKGGVA